MATLPGSLLLAISSPFARRGAIYEAWIASGDRGAITFNECAGLPRFGRVARAPRDLPDARGSVDDYG